MEIAEFLVAKRQLESDLVMLIGSRIKRFQQETGFTPDSLSVDTMAARMLSGARIFSIDSVSVSVPLDG